MSIWFIIAIAALYFSCSIWPFVSFLTGLAGMPNMSNMSIVSLSRFVAVAVIVTPKWLSVLLLLLLTCQ